MATTSLWRVRGYIGKVLLYAENPEKTTLPKSIGFDDADKDTLEDVIAYLAFTGGMQLHASTFIIAGKESVIVPSV